MHCIRWNEVKLHASILFSYAFLATIFLTIIVTLLAHSSRPDEHDEAKSICSETSYDHTIRWLLQKRKPVYVKWLKESSNTPYSLYNIQGVTNNHLQYNWLKHDDKMVEELILLHSLSLDTIKETNKYSFYYYPGSTMQSIHKMWFTDGDPVKDESF